jgi:hypothetical protein
VKKPIKINLNAPRMRKAQFSTIVFTKELYQRFKEKHPEHKEITWKEFKDRWAEITETIRTETVYNPSGVKLAFYLGELKYQYLPHKYKPLDRNSTVLNDEPTNFINLTTRGKTGILKWERRWAVNYFRMLRLFSFEADKRMNQMAKTHTLKNPESIRISRVTIGSKRWKK